MNSVLCSDCDWTGTVDPGVAVADLPAAVVERGRGAAWLPDPAARPRPLTKVSLLPSGRSLSVSRSRSFRFLSSVSQKRLREVLLIRNVELLSPCPVAPPVAVPREPEMTVVDRDVVSVVSRAMFT